MPASLRSQPKILMTADAVGGVWTYALDLAAGLGAAGVGVALAAIGPPPTASQQRQAASIPGLDLVGVDGPLDWTAVGEGDLRPVAERVSRLAQEVGASLIHLNSPALGALARFEQPILGAAHSCVSSWWSAVRGGDLPSDFAWRRDLLARGYGACGAVIAPSAAFVKTTSAIYGVLPTVVWNGRRLPSASHAPKRERFVLTAGRLWDEGKGVATLDRAAAQLQHPIIALGALQGPEGSAIRLEHIEAPGPQTADVTAHWMARAPIFASTALYEPFGLAVLEAAQAGAALVLSDIATFRELWDGAAIFVDPHDAADVAAALNWLLSDDATRQTLADQAQARAGTYTADAMAAATLKLYARLAPDAFHHAPREAAA